jgi:tetratricopeptide (TPR) repeat protein
MIIQPPKKMPHILIINAFSRERFPRGHLGNLGLAYSDLGEPRKAIEFYDQALQISREIGDRRGEGNHLGNLGLAYYKLGQRDKAIGYTKSALEIFEQIESPYAEQARKTLARWQEDEKPE